MLNGTYHTLAWLSDSRFPSCTWGSCWTRPCGTRGCRQPPRTGSRPPSRRWWGSDHSESRELDTNLTNNYYCHCTFFYFLSLQICFTCSHRGDKDYKSEIPVIFPVHLDRCCWLDLVFLFIYLFVLCPVCVACELKLQHCRVSCHPRCLGPRARHPQSPAIGAQIDIVYDWVARCTVQPKTHHLGPESGESKFI